MGKGARERAAREQERAQQQEPLTLFHGTSGAIGAYVKARGMMAAERAGLLLCETQELARDHALRATARMLADGSEDRRGLIVEVKIDPSRVTSVPDAPGHWMVSPGVRPNEVAHLHFFDDAGLADEDFVDALADSFDRKSEAWRRAATGEMGA
jgi:hypothetical protein